MTLTIGIDATAWLNERGDGRFVRNAVTRLVALHPEVAWSLYMGAADVGRAALPRGAEPRAVRQRRRPTEALAAGSARSPDDLARLALAVRRDRPDAFLLPSVYSWFPAPATPSVVGLHDATAATHAHLVLPGRRDRALWALKQRLALRSAERLFTVSEHARERIAANLGLDPARIAVVPEAADPVFAPRPPQEVADAMGRAGLSPEQPYLLFAAGLSPHKGLADLVKAYADLAEPAPTLLVAGQTGGPYPSAARSARELVADLGLGERVLFCGFLSDADLAALYTGAVGAVAPSHSEGFGLSAVEAAACGAPVVISDIGPHRETLGEAALLFPAGETAALRARLAELIADPAAARRLGERGRDAVAGLSWDATGLRLYELLASVVRR